MPDYRISIADAHAHRFGVELDVEVPEPDSDELIVSLPVWIPGSYMVREFARHLLRLEARDGRPGGAALPVEVVDKTTWRVRLGDGTTSTTTSRVTTKKHSRKSARRITLAYEVYGFDPSVRACYLDPERAFFNGTSLLLRVHGLEGAPHRLRFGPLPRGWDVATAMPRQGKQFVAADYDEAVDHPFELGTFWRGTFEARGIEHEFVVSGAWPSFDGERLLADSKAICEAQIDFWHGGDASAKPKGRRARRADAPFDHYLFILHAVDDGYGGLEHRASTALIASRKDLPRKAASKAAGADKAEPDKADHNKADHGKAGAGKAASDGYVTLLGLISHEYFHTWNVKRLKPAELARVDYARENHTALLWFFEGFTSYYDDLMLRRAGLIGDNRYLGLVAKQINMLRAAPGRKVQSVAQASFDAWTKYYRADENTPNLTVSYYVKGALVALAFDLTLRSEGSGSLDDVMRSLWHDSGAARGQGAIDEAAIAKALHTVAGRSLERELRAWVHGTDDPPWATLFETVGVSTSHESPPTLAALLGLRVAEASGSVIVKQVLDGGVALRAGVAAGDEILAFDGWRLRKLDDACAWWTAPRPFELTVVRDQRLRTLRVGPRAIEVAASAARPVVLAPAPRSDAALERRRQRWLQGG